MLHEAGVITGADNRDTPGGRTVMLAAFLRLIWLVCANSRSVSQPELAVSSRICRAIDYMRRHYTEAMTLQQLAGMAGMSESNFRHRFTLLMGMPPIEYLLRLRIEAAKEILRIHDVNIAEVSLRSGFQDCNYFTRKFRELTGVPPSKYRRKFADDIPAETRRTIASNAEEFSEIMENLWLPVSPDEEVFPGAGE